MTPEQQERFREIVKLMGTLLIARKDVKAVETQINRQWAWVPDRERVERGQDPTSGALIPFRMSDFEQHMTGKRCLGTYLLDTDSRTKFLAFDIDLKDRGEFLVVRDIEDIDRLTAGKSPEEIEGIIDLKDRGEFLVVRDIEDIDRLAGKSPEEIEGIIDLDAKIGNLEEAMHRPDLEPYRWGRSLLYHTAFAIRLQIVKLGLPTLEVVTGGGMHVLVPFGEAIPASEARGIGAEVMTACNFTPSKGDNFWVANAFSPVPADPAERKHPIEVEVFPKQDTNQGFGNLIRLPLGWHATAQRRTYFFDPEASGTAWDLPRQDALTALRAAANKLGV